MTTIARTLLALGFVGVTGVAWGQAAPGKAIQLGWPVRCDLGVSCVIQNHVDHDPGPGARDYNCGSLTYDKHSGVDIRLPSLRQQAAGVGVVAAARGKVLRVRDGVVDQSVRERGQAALKGQDCGNAAVIDHGGGWTTQYCHMARGSLTVRPGDAVEAGDLIGRIGLSGNTEYPHLHFMVRLGDEVQDPFTGTAEGTACGAPRKSLWNPALNMAARERSSAVLNVGFTSARPDMQRVEAGDLSTAAVTATDQMVAFVRAIGLQGGDVVSLRITGPDGGVLAENTLAPLDRAKAQQLIFAGRKAPAAGWPKGAYKASFEVRRAGKTALSQTFQHQITR
jgi:hypothetical protein